MKHRNFLTFLIFCILSVNSYAQSRGMKEVAEINLGNKVNIGKQYALFIAIDGYREWTPLKKPVSDAKEIRDILKNDYFIDEVIELYNGQATKQNIMKTFTDLQNKLGVHDSLFIYYAGHGYLDKNSEQGFWIPVDGGSDISRQDNWLPNSQIRGYISRFKTIHVFMVSDSCFSGDILNTSRSAMPQIDNDYFRKAYSLMSRQVLTSGASEQVPDQSEFSTALINCLRKNTEPLIDPLGIFNDVRRSVRSTTPLYGSLAAANHQEGATFIFFRKQTPVAVTPTPQTVYVINPSDVVPPPGWQGSAAIASDSELPRNGYYIATNIFAKNETVDIYNLETGKSTKVTVANGLSNPGLLAIVSREAAELIGMQANSVTKIHLVKVTSTSNPPPSDVYGIDPNDVVPEPEWGGHSASANNSNEIITGRWEVNKDNNSTAHTIINKERIDGKENDVLTISVNLAGKSPSWAGALIRDRVIIQKLANANGVRFKALGDGKKWRVYFATTDATDSAYYGTVITTQNGKVSSFDIPFRNLVQPAWGKKIPFNKNNILTISIERNYDLGATGASSIKVFDFEIY